MANYCGPKVRLSRRLGVPVSDTVKHVNRKKESRPGMHGYRRGRQSLYGLQLAEKQKIAFYYNVSNKQMRRYMDLAGRDKRATTVAFQELLESRFDNVIRRLGWARTIWQARQMVTHAHFCINGHKVDVPSYRIKPNDVVTVRDKSEKFARQAAENADAPDPPAWLAVTENKLEATVLHLPAFEDVRLPFEVDFPKIIEYYTR